MELLWERSPNPDNQVQGILPQLVNFYLGLAVQYLDLRYEDHCNPSDDDKSDRAKKIREILRSRKKPVLVIIERTTRKVTALMREMFWIELFKSRGMKLKNQESQK